MEGHDCQRYKAWHRMMIVTDTDTCLVCVKTTLPHLFSSDPEVICISLKFGTFINNFDFSKKGYIIINVLS